MDVGNIVALAGLGFTALALIVAVVSLSKRIQARAIEEAEERGKMAQRMAEAEQDIDRIGHKQRKVDDKVQAIEVSVAGIYAGQEHILKALDELSKKFDRHAERG